MRPDALGKPGEGAHFHVAGVAVVDLGLTALAAWWLSRALRTGFAATFALAMLAGLLVHRWVGVRTTLTRLVFG